MIPARLAPVVIAFFVSGAMSFLVSGLATWRALGMIPGFMSIWMVSWIFAWAVAFPALVVFRPVVTRVVMRWVKRES